jgi:hypothetical protein
MLLLTIIICPVIIPFDDDVTHLILNKFVIYLHLCHVDRHGLVKTKPRDISHNTRWQQNAGSLLVNLVCCVRSVFLTQHMWFLQENKREERKKLCDEDAMRKIKQLEEQAYQLQKQVASQKQVDGSWTSHSNFNLMRPFVSRYYIHESRWVTVSSFTLVYFLGWGSRSTTSTTPLCITAVCGKGTHYCTWGITMFAC